MECAVSDAVIRSRLAMFRFAGDRGGKGARLPAWLLRGTSIDRRGCLNEAIAVREAERATRAAKTVVTESIGRFQTPLAREQHDFGASVLLIAGAGVDLINTTIETLYPIRIKGVAQFSTQNFQVVYFLWINGRPIFFGDGTGNGVVAPSGAGLGDLTPFNILFTQGPYTVRFHAINLAGIAATITVRLVLEVINDEKNTNDQGGGW